MFKKAILVSAMLLATAGAQAQSAGFSVTGVVTPPTCTLTLGGGNSVIDFGSLTKTTVKSYNVSATDYVMPLKSMTFNITCSAAVRAELAFADNYAGKILSANAPDSSLWGMVDGTGTTGIGAYYFGLSAITLDGSAPVVGYVTAPTGTNTWAPDTNNGYVEPGFAMGFIKDAGQTVPQQFTTASGSLTAMSFLNKPYVDAAASTINIKGGGTITLQYL